MVKAVNNETCQFSQLRLDYYESQGGSYKAPSDNDDSGIMSEADTTSTGFRRGNRARASLPIVRTPSKTLERPLGEFAKLSLPYIIHA